MPSIDEHAGLKVDAAAPLALAAGHVLDHRLALLGKVLKKASSSKLRGEKGASLIHALRVGSRRAQAGVEAFAEVLDPVRRAKIDALLRRLRKAAGPLRDAQVHAQALGVLRAAAPKSHHAGLDHLLGVVQIREGKARKNFRASLDRAATIADGADRLLARRSASSERTLAQAATAVVQTNLERVRAAGEKDLSDVARVHDLRLCLKRLRYAAEIFGACLKPARRRALGEQLAELQESLGEVNDAFTLKELVAGVLDECRRDEGGDDPGRAALLRSLGVVGKKQASRLDQAHRRFLKLWTSMKGRSELRNAPPASQADGTVGAGGVSGQAGQIELKPRALTSTDAGLHGVHSVKAPKRQRLAAIDVGTNSVRLIVAEAAPDGSYRVLDDEKEITRLGKGLHATGGMDPGCIEHTADTIARMASIARGYGVSGLRVVGTSAAREAKNGAVLLERVRAASGVELEVITGDEEAMLAFRSASRAFDLSSQPALVLDIGGGSVELVLSAGSGEGGGIELAGASRSPGRPRAALIEHVFSLPLGAVRLTERFGGPERAGTTRFAALREHVKTQLRKSVGRPPIWPQVVIGTGGTLTTLGAMVLHQAQGGHSDGLFGKVQGTLVTRAQVRHLLDYARKLPVKDRTRVPGLSADRADIIVAGLVVVDVVLKYFGANRLKVHEGGIRDGLLLSMFGAQRLGVEGGDSALRPDPIRSVKRFAKECNYEASHAKQVTRLALRIFDQLAGAESQLGLGGPTRLDAEARLLLESAALLHDVGYLINYAQHHKHSYHLIVHADLPGLTTRQIQVIANVARYHRAADPKLKHGPFARLSPDDQTRVRQLSAILRVADGLDRTHMQSIRDVVLRVGRQSVDLKVTAPGEPSVDIWGAVRKAGLFREVFSRVVNVEWTATPVMAEVRQTA